MQFADLSGIPQNDECENDFYSILFPFILVWCTCNISVARTGIVYGNIFFIHAMQYHAMLC